MPIYSRKRGNPDVSKMKFESDLAAGRTYHRVVRRWGQWKAEFTDTYSFFGKQLTSTFYRTEFELKTYIKDLNRRGYEADISWTAYGAVRDANNEKFSLAIPIRRVLTGRAPAEPTLH